MNFRKALVALAVIALFAGLASAQIVTPPSASQIPCSVSPDKTLQVRAEGTSERVGDVLITCTGGPTLTAPFTADRATITVNFGVPVTSKQNTASQVTFTPPGGAATNYGNASEALLLIDEPNTIAAASAPIPGYGQNAPMSACSVSDALASYQGAGAPVCPAVLRIQGGYYTMDNGAAATGANAYQGVVLTGNNNTKVVFYNVPVIAPGPNASRIYRITNVRVTPGSSAVNATVSVTAATGAATALSLSSASAAVATPLQSFTTTITNPGLSLCLNAPATGAASPFTLAAANKLSLVTLTETFNNAFKPVLVPGKAATAQNVATGSYGSGLSYTMSESGTVLAAGGATVTLSNDVGAGAAADPFGVPGLANTGSRIKLVFSGLPTNATLWISQTNVADIQTPVATRPAAFYDATNATFASYVGGSTAASLTASEAIALGGTPAAPAATANVASYTNVYGGTITFNQLTAVTADGADKGKAEAVYEVTNVKKNSLNTLNFAIYVSYSNNPASAPTTNSTLKVNAGYAPTDTTTAAAWSNQEPRFSAISGDGQTFYKVLPCQTSLMFPYVIGVNGYSTGLAISNTSADTFQTQTSKGTCDLNFFSGATPVKYTTAAEVLPGTAWAASLNTGNQLSDGSTTAVLDGFSGVGYMIATCNFQFAHGFAFIAYGQPTTAGYAAMGYTAGVISDSNRGATLSGEGLGM